MKTGKNFAKAHLALFVVSLFYGLNYSIAKDVMPDFIQPRGFIFIRAGVAMAMFWLLHLFLPKDRIEIRDLLRFAACGLFGVAINQLLFFEGLNITTPINASVIMTSNPILVLVLAAVLLKEKITLLKTLGIGAGIIGAISLLTLKGDLTFGSETIMGDLFILINACSYGIYLILAKPLLSKYNPVTVIKWAFTFGFLFVIPFGAVQFNEIQWLEFPAIIWGEVAFVVFGVTFFTYLLNVYALQSLSPAVVSTYIYLQPVLATAVALILGSDALNWVQVISGVLICIGVFLVSLPTKTSLQID